mmetsp:Transcript_73559/g.116931  ORF Transcript_73559/g.116931 Transcript_73559/m.116931 type:complete len:286 (-) Transcript_73559:441-1298(-)
MIQPMNFTKGRFLCENNEIARKKEHVPVMAMWSMAVKIRTEAGRMLPVAFTMPDNLATYCTFSKLPKPAPAAIPHKTTTAGEAANFRNQPQHGMQEMVDIRGNLVKALDFIASSRLVTNRSSTINLKDSSTIPGVSTHSRFALATQPPLGASIGHFGPTGMVALQSGSAAVQINSSSVLKTPAHSAENMAPAQNMLMINPALTGSLLKRFTKYHEGTMTTIAPKDSITKSASSSQRSPGCAVMKCFKPPARRRRMVQKVQAVVPSRCRSSVRLKSCGGATGAQRK